MASASIVPPPSPPSVSALRCDGCDAVIEGEAPGHGTYVWSRGGQTVIEEVPLCAACALAIHVTTVVEEEIEDGLRVVTRAPGGSSRSPAPRPGAEPAGR